MSIFKKQALVSSSPAFNVFAREADHKGLVNITADDILALDTGKGYHRTYSPGSVVSYALQNNECPMEAVERCKANMIRDRFAGHKLHWINARASVISSHQRAAEDCVLVTIGMRVRFEGQEFTIAADHNSNLKFAA